MRKRRIVLAFGLLIASWCALFPPRVYREDGKVAPRGFLLSSALYEQRQMNHLTHREVPYKMLDLDFSKLLVEWALVGMLTACVCVISRK